MPKTRSKKGTKQWRQNSKVDDIEDTLHEIRKEELKGGPAAKKQNEQLFFMDKGGVQTKKRAQERKLKIDEILAPNKFVKSFRSTPPSTKINTAEKETLSKIVKHLEKTGTQNQSRRIRQTIKPYDLWNIEEPKDKSDQQFENGFDNPMAKRSVKAPKHQEPKPVPAVKIEAPGNSYNPDEASHSELLTLAAKEAIRKDKSAEKIERQLPSINRVAHSTQVKQFLKSVIYEANTGEKIDDREDEDSATQLLLADSQTFFIQEKSLNPEKKVKEKSNSQIQTQKKKENKNEQKNNITSTIQNNEEINEESEVQNEINDNQVISLENMNVEDAIVKPVVSSENRKTKLQKRKEQNKLLQIRQEIKKKRKERREKKFQHLDKIVQKIDGELQQQRKRRIKRSQKLEATRSNPKRLGKVAFEAPEIDFKFKEQISGSLRTLVPEGNLLKSRQLSFQERNIIEPRLPSKGRRGNFKVIDRRRHVGNDIK